MVIRKEADLPYLTQRLICHVDCNSLTPGALRQLFVSNREGARSGTLLQSIRHELVNVLSHDDELVRLNDEARNATLKERDESAVQEARKVVAKMLRLHGMDIRETATAPTTSPEAETKPTDKPRPFRPRKPPKPREPIELHTPPMYIHILWPDKPIPFHAEQRRYMRIETDADSSFHDATDPNKSRINFIVTDGEVAYRGSSPLQGGRTRAVFDCQPSAKVGGKGKLRVELSRSGLETLFDEREFEIVEPPVQKEEETKLNLPDFDYQPVSFYENSDTWSNLEWPDDIAAVASSSVDADGVHTVYYSTDFPAFKSRFDAYAKRDPDLAKSYENRYGIWLVVHSLLYKHQSDEAKEQSSENEVADDERRIAAERAERIRVATLSAMIAAREMQLSEAGVNLDPEEA